MSGLTRLTKFSLAAGAATAALALLAPGAMAQARAQEASTNAITIQSQDLDDALRALARQTGTQILFEPSSVRGHIAPEVAGAVTPEQALRRLLADTGLTYRSTGAGTFTILAQAPDVRPTQTGADPIAPANQEEEIIVTAQKREERLQDVPLSVSVAGSRDLADLGATRLQDYAGIIPGLQVTSQSGQPGSTNITLRGISTADLNSTTTATMVDDVPVSATSAHTYAALNGADLTPYDVDRVEVLRGPQGTLYGATSLGGLLKYVTPTPELNDRFIRLAADALGIDHEGSQFGHSERLVANLPIVDGVFGVNFSASQVYTPGYIDNLATGEEAYNDGTQESARLTFLLEPSAEFSAKLMLLYNHSDFNGLGTILYDRTTSQPVYGYTTSLYEAETGDERRQRLAIATLNYDFGWANLTSVTGFSLADGGATYDISALLASFGLTTAGGDPLIGPGFNSFDTERVTQEFRLSSSGESPLQWMLGYYYADEDNDYYELDDALDSTTGLPDATWSPLVDANLLSTVTEHAVFGNLTYNITHAWDIGVGARYSENDQTYAYLTLPGTLDPPSLVMDPTSDDSTTYSLSSSYHFTPDVMVYGRIATGYRPGGANQTFPGAPLTYSPDTVTSYEAGLRSMSFDNRLLLNLTAFYIDWQDIQVTQRTPAGLAYVANGGGAVSQGLEFDGAFVLSDNWRLLANAAYTDATITTDAPGIGAVDGDHLPYTPELSGAVTLEWSETYADGSDSVVRATWRHVGDRLSNFPGSITGDATLAEYEVLDLSGALNFGDWRFNAFVRNATDEEAFLSVQNFGATILLPRTFGVGLEYRFD